MNILIVEDNLAHQKITEYVLKHNKVSGKFFVVRDGRIAEVLNAGASLPPGATIVDVPNNHLSYAFTWFSLAGVLLVVFALFARGRLASGDRRA